VVSAGQQAAQSIAAHGGQVAPGSRSQGLAYPDSSGIQGHSPDTTNKNNFALYQHQERQRQLAGEAAFAQDRNAPQAGIDNPFRRAQLAQLALLRSQALGHGPSLAELQAQRAGAQGLRQQMALAASARPGQGALAARQAAQNMGQIGMGTGYNAMMGRLQEQQQAQNALNALIQQGRGADQQNAQFNVDAALRQAGMNDQYFTQLQNLMLGNAQAQQQGAMGYENNLLQRYGIQQGKPEDPAWWEQLLGFAIPAAVGVGTGVATGSPQAGVTAGGATANVMNR